MSRFLSAYHLSLSSLDRRSQDFVFAEIYSIIHALVYCLGRTHNIEKKIEHKNSNAGTSEYLEKKYLTGNPSTGSS